MQPSNLLVMKIGQSECIVHIRHDIAVLTRRRSTREDCNIPTRLFPDRLSPDSKRARQTINPTMTS